LLLQFCTSCKTWKSMQLLTSRRATILTECQIKHDLIYSDVKIQLSKVVR
jgi:hypothetical protein